MVAFDLIIPKGKWFVECRLIQAFHFRHEDIYEHKRLCIITYRKILRTTIIIKNGF